MSKCSHKLFKKIKIIGLEGVKIIWLIISSMHHVSPLLASYTETAKPTTVVVIATVAAKTKLVHHTTSLSLMSPRTCNKLFVSLVQKFSPVTSNFYTNKEN
jgi:hypothetical protein